jgi:hypothetical protein
MSGSLPLAPDTPGAADGGLGGELPGLPDDIRGLAAESLGGAFAVGRHRGLMPAVLAHALMECVGGDQQAQPVGRPSGIDGQAPQHFEGVGQLGPQTGAVDLSQPLMGELSGLPSPAVGTAEPRQEDPAGSGQRGADGLAGLQGILDCAFGRSQLTRPQQQGCGGEAVPDDAAIVAVRLRSPVASSVAARLAHANNSTTVSPTCLAAAVPCSSRRAAEVKDPSPASHTPARISSHTNCTR